ncbi:hypothetical protein [Asticcacaulis machinosus]|uniref:Uncharacterized protein n=1 Tax=Asticcacaulis machinosus TaxID=2984211 RepID=A0ABT5HEK7_9CAUL|nr:hypothetical protein [Asticcacaulis machinosus]MDC7674690.1 hypothetical protein [Asticcacaulis machinosus]
MTLQQVFDMFMSDPSKKRAWTTMARYRETMGVVFEVIPPDTPIKKVDRVLCRQVLEMVQWLPANATKPVRSQSSINAPVKAYVLQMLGYVMSQAIPCTVCICVTEPVR